MPTYRIKNSKLLGHEISELQERYWWFFWITVRSSNPDESVWTFQHRCQVNYHQKFIPIVSDYLPH